MTCNPCDDCAPKCNECCNPNIVWWECVDVDVSEEGVITISAPCPTEVTSDDWTIGVTEKEPHEWYSKRFDLTVNKPDRLVAASWCDENPGTLNDKIIAWHWIDKAITWCPNGKLELAVDESELNIPNNKVAVDWSCSPDYLWNLFRSTSNLVEIVPSWCEMLLRDKSDPIVCWKITMQDNVTWWVDWCTSCDWNVYYIAWSNWSGLRNWNFNVDFLYNMETANNNNWLKIKRRWIYEVWFRCSLEASFWIHAVRWWLYVLRANWGYYPILESRFSWPVWVEPSELWKWEEWFNALYMNEWTETSWVGWKSASLWAVLDRMPCQDNTIIILEPWDILFLWMKWQARTLYEWDNLVRNEWWDEWWEIAMLWAVGNQAWVDIWAQIWANLKYSL